MITTCRLYLSFQLTNLNVLKFCCETWATLLSWKEVLSDNYWRSKHMFKVINIMHNIQWILFTYQWHCDTSSSVLWRLITCLTMPGRIWRWRYTVQAGGKVFLYAKSLTLIPSFSSSAADGCRFPIRLGGFRGMIVAFAWLRGFEATIAVDMDIIIYGSCLKLMN